MAQTKEGALQLAARKAGMLPGNYLARVLSGEKWCYKCREWRPVAGFDQDRSRSDGRAAVCKICRHVRKAPGPSKPERQTKRAQGMAWCSHCGAWLPVAAVRSGLCRPHANEAARRRYATDERVRAERRQHTQGRRRGVAPVPTEGQINLTDDFEGCCAYCGRPASAWDHIIAVTHGGQTTPDNIVPCCISCNSSKGNRDLWEWLASRPDLDPLPMLAERLALYGTVPLE